MNTRCFPFLSFFFPFLFLSWLRTFVEIPCIAIKYLQGFSTSLFVHWRYFHPLKWEMKSVHSHSTEKGLVASTGLATSPQPANKSQADRMDIKPAVGTTAQVVLSSLGAEEPEREQTSRGARGILQWSLRWLRQYPSPSPRSGPASPRLRLRLLPLLRRRRRRRSRGWLRCKDQNSSTSSTFYLHT